MSQDDAVSPIGKARLIDPPARGASARKTITEGIVRDLRGDRVPEKVSTGVTAKIVSAVLVLTGFVVVGTYLYNSSVLSTPAAAKPAHAMSSAPQTGFPG